MSLSTLFNQLALSPEQASSIQYSMGTSLRTGTLHGSAVSQYGVIGATRQELFCILCQQYFNFLSFHNLPCNKLSTLYLCFMYYLGMHLYEKDRFLIV
jgi:hypothetical protein